MKNVKKWAPDWRTVLSALLIVAAFPPWNHAWLIWIAVIPWLAALDRAPTLKRAAYEGLWLSILMSFGGFYWVADVLHEFGELPWPVAITGLAMFCLIGQPQFTIFGPLRKWMGRQLGSARTLGRTFGLLILLYALIYTGIDWILPKLFVDTFGHAFHQSPWVRQVADIAGPTGLTFLVYLFNEAAYQGLRSWPRLQRWLSFPHSPLHHARASRIAFTAVALLTAAAVLYGYRREIEVHEWMATSKQHAQFGIVQANIGDFEKIAAERGGHAAAQKVLSTFFGLSDRALALSPRPQAIVWPETSYPTTFRTPQNPEEEVRDRALEEWVKLREVPLLFGGYDHADGKDFNALFYLSPLPSGTPVGTRPETQAYRKNMLLLFGEYIPGAETFPFLKAWFPQVGNFGRGQGPEIISLRLPNAAKRPDLAEDIRTNPVICYEALFPNFVLDAARKGSQVILNITNDSWFGPTAEPELHLALASFRSIEARIPQLRSTNTGISTVVMPDGSLSEQTRLFEPQILNVAVPIYPQALPTLMKRWGDWFGPFSAVAALLGLAWFEFVTGALRRIRRPRRIDTHGT